MELVCPQCHKHRFGLWQFIFLGFNRQENPVYCPRCSAGFTLERKAENLINLVFGAAFFTYIGLCFALGPRLPVEWSKPALLLTGFSLVGVTRWLAVMRFGKIAPAKVEAREPYPRIRLSDVEEEVHRLKVDGDFFVLFATDEETYVSFGRSEGTFQADLAFPVEKFKHLEPAFRAAAAKAGVTAKSYHKHGLHGVEAELGGDPKTVASKVRTIVQGTFGVKSDAEVPLMRGA